MPTQNENGRAYEYAIAKSLADLLPAPIADNNQLTLAKACFDLFSTGEQASLIRSANESILFLVAHDLRLSDNGCVITIQADKKGQQGDVRDIIVKNLTINDEVGISAKHHHAAVKHPRLSDKIDFGLKWFGVECSDQYFQQVKPIFDELRSLRKQGILWSNIPNKAERFYLPILDAFSQELKGLLTANPYTVAPALVKYLLGRNDFYKIIKINGTTTIQSFNIDGTLRWGGKIPLPTRVIEIERKPDTDTTTIIVFDKGWQISFRVHNASSRAEPSVKFDIQLVGMPPQVAKHVTRHNG